MFLIILGIGIIFLGVGLFIGKMMSGPHINKSDNFISKGIENLKANIAQKKEEKRFANEIKKQARREAMLGMKDDLIKYYKDDEKKKLTGEKRKEKLEKLKKAFSMDNMDTGNKLQNMLGTNSNTGVNNDRLSQMMGSGNKAGVNNDDIARMMGRRESSNNNKKKSNIKKDLSFDDFLNKL